jgi:hypothetical protein
MSNLLRRAASPIAAPLASLLLLSLFLPLQAMAQSSAPPTALEKQLDRVDLGVSAAALFSNTVSGTEQRDQLPLTLHPSSTVGELATLRYTAKPYVGLEFNFSNARLTENFTNPENFLAGGVQTRVREMDFGYIVHPRFKPFGIQPFAGAGAGTLQFKPTTFGGQGLPEQYRAVYYYTAGLEDNFPGSHFGMRVAFRQLIYLGPDFLQNYLIMLKHVRTTDPTVGFFVRF